MSRVCYNKGADKFEVDEDYKVKNNIDFTTITACGECCVGCKKKRRWNLSRLHRVGWILYGMDTIQWLSNT